jgi:hypothetical protein
MARQSRRNNKQNSHSNAPPSINTGDSETNPSVQNTDSTYSSGNTGTEKPPILKRVIRFIGNKDRQPAIANIVSVLMFIATIWLAIITLNVFKQTVRQTEIADISANAAKTSADAAKKSADLQKQALDSQVSYQRKADIADIEKTKRDIATFNLQKTALDKQIDALKETQKEFEKINEPILAINELTGFVIDTIKNFSFRYNIVNLGNNPITIFRGGENAKLFSVLKDSATYYDRAFDPAGNFMFRKGSVNVTKESPHHGTFVIRMRFSTMGLDSFKKGQIAIDYYGSYFYTSSINNRNRRFDFGIIIKYMTEIGDVYYTPKYTRNYYVK